MVKNVKSFSFLSGFFWDNTSTYFIGYKTHNKINQLKGDRVVEHGLEWLLHDIVYTPDIYKYNRRELFSKGSRL
jgi:hypothetical protein